MHTWLRLHCSYAKKKIHIEYLRCLLTPSLSLLACVFFATLYFTFYIKLSFCVSLAFINKFLSRIACVCVSCFFLLLLFFFFFLLPSSRRLVHSYIFNGSKWRVKRRRRREQEKKKSKREGGWMRIGTLNAPVIGESERRKREEKKSTSSHCKSMWILQEHRDSESKYKETIRCEGQVSS